MWIGDSHDVDCCARCCADDGDLVDGIERCGGYGRGGGAGPHVDGDGGGVGVKGRFRCGHDDLQTKAEAGQGLPRGQGAAAGSGCGALAGLGVSCGWRRRLTSTTDVHTVRLDHVRAGRWTTETVPFGDGGGVLLTGTSWDDVWPGVGASLRRYDGSRWTTVALPACGFRAGPWDITPVNSPCRGVLYAALSGDGWYVSSRVFRYAKGRWTALGASSRTRVSPGLFDEGRGRRAPDPRPLDPMCQQRSGVEPLVECTTTRAAAASAQLRNGTIVLAEDDYYRFVAQESGTTQFVEGGFGLRALEGREIPLAGDSGDTTLFVVPGAHRNAAWAVTGTQTDTGWKSYLQRNEG